MQRVAKGLYLDSAKAMHFDVDEFIEDLPFAKTPENVAVMTKAAVEGFKKAFGNTEVWVIGSVHEPEGPNGRDR